jgi:glycosyltransferase involved in cell wall biosynthesis
MPPPVHGAAMMGKYIHDSKLINESFDCHYINLTTAKNLEDIGHFRLGKIVEFVKLLHRIRKTIKQLKPDLVYVTPNAKGGAFYKDFIVVEMIKSMGCKVIVHYHNKGVATRQDRWLDDKLYRKFFHGIKVILLAEALYPDVQKYVRREDVYICPNGIPDTTGGKEPTAERHNKIPHLLFLSNLLESKGVIVLLDALKILKERGYSFVCDFVGGETAEIDAARFNEEVEKRGLNQLVIYNGKKFGDDKEAYYEKADVFVFPTYYPNECFPLVLLEAMQQGLPCISTKEGGITSIIDDGKTGLLVNRQDADDLADKIAWMIEHPKERIDMGVEGYRKTESMFIISQFEENLATILEDNGKERN